MSFLLRMRESAIFVLFVFVSLGELSALMHCERFITLSLAFCVRVCVCVLAQCEIKIIKKQPAQLEKSLASAQKVD